jgi:hypothetical protein
VQRHEPPREREPDAEPALGALERALALREEVEDALEERGRNPEPVVAHLDDAFVAFSHGPTRRSPAFRGVLGGVVEQVEDDLREPRDVAVHHDGQADQVDFEAVAPAVDERARASSARTTAALRSIGSPLICSFRA